MNEEWKNLVEIEYGLALMSLKVSLVLGFAFCLLTGIGEVYAQSPETGNDVPEEDSPLESNEPDGVDNNSTGDDTTASRTTDVWREPAPLRIGVAVDAAVVPELPGTWFVIGQEGQVWKTRDGGVNWTMVMRPNMKSLGEDSPDEELLLGIEARMEEVMDESSFQDLDELAEELEDLTEEQLEEEIERVVQDTMRDAVEEVQADLGADPNFVGATSPRARVGADSRIWVFGTEFVFAARSDGLHFSKDGGRRWRRVMETMTHSLSRLQDGLWIAGTADGARVAVDPEAWFDVFDGTEARSFRTLAAVSDGVLAGAEDGLWFSPDGHTWIRRDGLTEPVLAMTVDTQEENAVWIVTTSGLHHTQDSGSTVGPLLPIPVPLRDVTSVASLGFGRFLVGGGDGVVETTDGGVTWALKNQGLERVNGARIVMSDRTHVLLVAGGRVYQLKEVGAEQDEELIEQLEPWIPLDELVYSAVSRSGMTEVMNPRRLRIRSYFVPQLRLEGRFRDYSDLNFDRFNGTAFDTRGELLVLGLLTWTPRVRTRTDLGVLTSDMQDPLVILGDGGLTAALRVNQNLARYHAQVSDLVIERYRARMRLVRERPRLQNLSLLSRVLHELGVQHVEADLDVLTEGAVGRWYLERRMASESMEL